MVEVDNCFFLAKLRFSFNLLLHFVAFFVVGTRLCCLLHNPRAGKFRAGEPRLTPTS